MSHVLRPGDTVIVRGGFGTDPPRAVKVKSIEVIEHQDDNEGASVNEVAWDDIKRCRVELDDGPWAYGGQLERVPDERELVIGQCPYCSGINRCEPNCPRPPTRAQAAAAWNKADAAIREKNEAFETWLKENPLASDDYHRLLLERAFTGGWLARGRRS